jgi:hypothetical protein
MHQACPKVLCPNCGARLAVSSCEPAIACSCGALFRLDQSIPVFVQAGGLGADTRGRRAQSGSRNPFAASQISNTDCQSRTLRGSAASASRCISGPRSRLRPWTDNGHVTDEGYRVIAVDFSAASLRIRNGERQTSVTRDLCRREPERLARTQSEIRGADVADFLQHLGGPEAQCRFVNNIMPALFPGGMFYLSCPNYDIKNMLKNDRIGSFHGGAMPGAICYRRARVAEIVAMIPNEIEIFSVRAMNVFHGAAADRLVTKLPFSFLLARMIVVTGRRRAA